MASKVQKVVQTLIASLGLKRKLANLFQVLSVVILTTPVLKDYASILQAIASWLGVVGVGHAVGSSVANSNRSTPSKKITASTIGAFFSALALAAKSVPELQPYAAVITAVATILGLFGIVSLATPKIGR